MTRVRIKLSSDNGPSNGANDVEAQKVPPLPQIKQRVAARHRAVRLDQAESQRERRRQKPRTDTDRDGPRSGRVASVTDAEQTYGRSSKADDSRHQERSYD